MSFDAFDSQDTEATMVNTTIRLAGTGATDPTLIYGKGVSVQRLALGQFRVTWKENPGFYTGYLCGLGAAVPANMAGCTVICIPYNNTGYIFDVYLFSGGTTPAARDLAAAEFINLDCRFKRNGIS